MKREVFVLLPVVSFLLTVGVPLWERRDKRELYPLGAAWLLGGLAAAASLAFWRVWVPPPPFSGLPWIPGVFLLLPQLVVLWILVRWPWAETPMDALWLGVAAASGTALSASLGACRWGVPEWLASCGFAGGALMGGVLGVQWRLRGRPWRFGVHVVLLGVAVGLGWLWVTLEKLLSSPWLLWLVAGNVVLLAAAVGVWVEARVLGPLLAEEAQFGLIPPWVAEAGAHFGKRFSRRWARRRDERKALVGLVVRLGACKAYLARQGKHRSTAVVELGRLRERARRLFAAPPQRVE